MIDLFHSPTLPQLLADDIAASPAEGGMRREFSPQLAYGRHDGPAPRDARHAAVAIVLCWDSRRWSIPLTVRSSALNHHGGQVSFPGGLVDEGESVTEAALRELEEELGVRPQVEWLGELAPLYVFASNAVMSPCVAVVRECPSWQPSSAEVEAVLRLDAGELTRQNCSEPLAVRRGPLEFAAPQFVVEGRSVWGATTVVLGELRGRLRRIANLDGA